MKAESVEQLKSGSLKMPEVDKGMQGRKTRNSNGVDKQVQNKTFGKCQEVKLFPTVTVSEVYENRITNRREPTKELICKYIKSQSAIKSSHMKGSPPPGF